MDPTASLHPTPQGWLLNSDLTPHVDGFVEHLRQGRYAASTINRYLGCIARFARWMSLSYLPIDLLDEATVGQFLGNHLPRCDCSAPVVRVHGDLRAACRHLLEVLRDRGVVAEPAPATGPIAGELRCFDEPMRGVRGHDAKARSARLRIVRRLLLQRFAARPS